MTSVKPRGNIKEGDSVAMINFKGRSGPNRKLVKRYLGPYKVLKCKPPDYCIQRPRARNSLWVHGSNLKKLHVDTCETGKPKSCIDCSDLEDDNSCAPLHGYPCHNPNQFADNVIVDENNVNISSDEYDNESVNSHVSSSSAESSDDDFDEPFVNLRPRRNLRLPKRLTDYSLV